MSKHILLVDDFPSFVQPLADELMSRGHSVTIATDGSEALKLVDGGFQYDVLITDENMPKMNGSDLIRELRRRGLSERPMYIFSSIPNCVPADIGVPVFHKSNASGLIAASGL